MQTLALLSLLLSGSSCTAGWAAGALIAAGAQPAALRAADAGGPRLCGSASSTHSPQVSRYLRPVLLVISGDAGRELPLCLAVLSRTV
jgi:hypothetical protein